MMFVHYMSYSYMKYACVYNIYVSEINNKKKKKKKKKKKNCLYELVLMATHNIPFEVEIRQTYLDFIQNIWISGANFLGTQERVQMYSKTCLKRPLKNRQNKDLNDKWKLNEGQKYCRMFPFEGQKYCRMLKGEHSAILLTCIKQ